MRFSDPLCAKAKDKDLWFAEYGTKKQLEAIEICKGCIDKGRCLEYAKEHHIRYGVWGGECFQKRYGQAYQRQRPMKLVEFRGQKKTLYAWSKELFGEATIVPRRIKRGWSIEKALTTPRTAIGGANLIEFRGETKSIRDWAKKFSMNEGTLWQRLNRLGMTLEQALTTPVHSRSEK
jgi:hypothetical protein